jgi:negative regulator of flagellin synthesis FlgM
MTIGRIGSVEQIYNETNRLNPLSKTVKADSVSISKEALAQADTLHAEQLIKAAPDVRADRVAELKAKINDPNYLNDTIIRGTADKIVDMLFPGL